MHNITPHFPVSTNAHRLNVLNEIRERGVCPVWLKDLPLVEQGIDQVWIVVQIVR